MKEEIKKYFKNDTYKLEEEKRNINDNYILYYDLMQELKDKPEEERKKEIEKYNKQQEERQKKLISINNNIDIKTIEDNLIYNNIIYLFKENYHNKIMNIMEKYQNKNIGEKTKEKIQEEITELLKNDNIYASVYFSFGSYSSDIYNLNFTIYRTEEEKKQYSYKRITFDLMLCNYYNEEDQKKYINYYIYRNEKTGSNILNNNKIWDNNQQYNYISDTKKQAKIILKECKKSMEKVNKLIQQATEERKKHNLLLDIYKVHEFDNITIKYNQTL